jgi:hypothetical protein
VSARWWWRSSSSSRSTRVAVTCSSSHRPPTSCAALTLVHGTLELFASWLRGELDVTREHLTDFLVALVRTTGDLR